VVEGGGVRGCSHPLHLRACRKSGE
jgi:hypothetical protein